MNITTWTHPTTGQTRQYLDNADVEDMALKIGRRTDNRLSNADLGRIQAAKFWIDQDGVLHIDKLAERGKIHWIITDLRTALEATIKADQETVTATPTIITMHTVGQLSKADPVVYLADQDDPWNQRLVLTADQYNAMGEPETITVTITPS